MKKSIVNELLSILNKEDIESSMLFIDTNGIPKGRQSNTFDVVSNLGQNYPPPFLLKTAYNQKTGQELPGDFFDNIGKDSLHFKIIKDLGFNILAKNQNGESIKSYLEEFAKLIPQELKEKSGSVFYSGKNAFKGKKELYILGLNPGGSETLQETETIAWHTKKTLTIGSDNWSEYKDERWKGALPGTFGLQPRVLHMLNKLNLSPYEVPASNVCFVRSPREKNIANFLKQYSEMCWPVHQKIIDDLGVKVVLCFGQTAANIVRKKLGANEQIDEFIETNKRNWKSRVFKNTKDQIVISATHPSIADWTNPNTDPSQLVKKYLN